MKLHSNITTSTTATFELMDANTNDLSTNFTNDTYGVNLSHSVMNDAVASIPSTTTSRRDDHRLVLPSPPGNDLSRNMPVPIAPVLSGRNDEESLER